MELLGKTNIDFIGMRKVSFVISGIIALLGIIGIIGFPYAWQVMQLALSPRPWHLKQLPGSAWPSNRCTVR